MSWRELRERLKGGKFPQICVPEPQQMAFYVCLAQPVPVIEYPIQVKGRFRIDAD